MEGVGSPASELLKGDGVQQKQPEVRAQRDQQQPREGGERRGARPEEGGKDGEEARAAQRRRVERELHAVTRLNVSIGGGLVKPGMKATYSDWRSR